MLQIEWYLVKKMSMNLFFDITRTDNQDIKPSPMVADDGVA